MGLMLDYHASCYLFSCLSYKLCTSRQAREHQAVAKKNVGQQVTHAIEESLQRLKFADIYINTPSLNFRTCALI